MIQIEKKQPKSRTGKKAGGQKGHVGNTVKKVDDPDRVEVIKVDRSSLPPGRYWHSGFESRQVFDIDISRVVTEYRAQILEDDKGNRFVAPFPEGVKKAVQYGTGLKAYSVYKSQFQLVPYNRIQDYFADQLYIPISEGSIFNFKQEAFRLLADFENRVKNAVLIYSMAALYRLRVDSSTGKPVVFCLRPHKKAKRDQIKKSKSRNLLERLRDYEQDSLSFMDNEHVPFSNNFGENDIRTTKVQQKISGCFRSMNGAHIFCRIRSFLSTCRKQGVKSSHALDLSFTGKLPDFLL